MIKIQTIKTKESQKTIKIGDKVKIIYSFNNLFTGKIGIVNDIHYNNQIIGVVVDRQEMYSGIELFFSMASIELINEQT